MGKRKKSRSSKSKKSAEDRAFEKAERVLVKNCENILRRKGVTGVDVNYRTKNGKRTDEIVIRIFVEKKLPHDELHPAQRIGEIDGIPVDYVEAQMDYEHLAGGLMPVQGGMRVAPVHNPGGAGTLGITCFKKGTREPRFLTNAHVVFGGKTKSSLPTRIPMILDPRGGTSSPLGDAIKADCFLNFLIDCALIEPNGLVDPKPGVPGLLPVPAGVGELTRQDINNHVRVKKLGERTGETVGIVDSVGLALPVTGRNFMFQIGIKPVPGGGHFSNFGDSGSVVVRGNEIVGLLHGVANNGTLAVACHMTDVVAKLDIEFT